MAQDTVWQVRKHGKLYQIRDLSVPGQIDEKIGLLVGQAPEALDTIYEIAAAIGEDGEALQGLLQQVGSKANSSDVYTKQQVDALLGEVELTPDHLGKKEVVSDSFDYIYDEASWNASFANGALHKYYTAYPDEDRYNTQAHRWAWESDKVNGEWPEYCIQCWEGAISADGAKFPWICPNFETDVNAVIKFQYKGEEDVYPWGQSRVFGKGNDHKEWGTASVGEEFKNNSFLIPQLKNGNEIYNGDPSWSGTAGDKNFDINKFRMVLVKQAEDNTIKSYVDTKIDNLKFQLS